MSLGALELPRGSLAFLDLCGPVQGSAGSCFVLSDRACLPDPLLHPHSHLPLTGPGPGPAREQPFLHLWGTPSGYHPPCPIARSRNESRWAWG